MASNLGSVVAKLLIGGGSCKEAVVVGDGESLQLNLGNVLPCPSGVIEVVVCLLFGRLPFGRRGISFVLMLEKARLSAISFEETRAGVAGSSGAPGASGGARAGVSGAGGGAGTYSVQQTNLQRLL